MAIISIWANIIVNYMRSLGTKGVFYCFDLDSPVMIYEESCPSWVVFLANTNRVLCNIKIFRFFLVFFWSQQMHSVCTWCLLILFRYLVIACEIAAYPGFCSVAATYQNEAKVQTFREDIICKMQLDVLFWVVCSRPVNSYSSWAAGGVHPLRTYYMQIE